MGSHWILYYCFVSNNLNLSVTKTVAWPAVSCPLRLARHIFEDRQTCSYRVKSRSYGRSPLVLGTHPGEITIAATSERGTSYDLHATAPGKVFLVWSEPEASFLSQIQYFAQAQASTSQGGKTPLSETSAYISIGRGAHFFLTVCKYLNQYNSSEAQTVEYIKRSCSLKPEKSTYYYRLRLVFVNLALGVLFFTNVFPGHHLPLTSK